MSETATTEAPAVPQPKAAPREELVLGITQQLSLVLSVHGSLHYDLHAHLDLIGMGQVAWAAGEVQDAHILANEQFATLTPEIIVSGAAFAFPKSELPRVQAWLAKVQA